MEKKYSIVIDTNVFMSALRSKNGASYKLLFDTDREKFDQNLSTALLYEYESISKQESQHIYLSVEQMDDILDMLCFQSIKCQLFYLWRPLLKDPKDEMVLELAIRVSK